MVEDKGEVVGKRINLCTYDVEESFHLKQVVCFSSIALVTVCGRHGHGYPTLWVTAELSLLGEDLCTKQIFTRGGLGEVFEIHTGDGAPTHPLSCTSN